MGLLPGWPIEAGKAEIAQVVAQAAQAHRFLANNPPDPVWNGFQAAGCVLGPAADEGLAAPRAARADAGSPDAPLPKRRMTARTDTRFCGRKDIPACCCGPRAENIHGFDAPVHPGAVREVTGTLACFIARWCGPNRIGGCDAAPCHRRLPARNHHLRPLARDPGGGRGHFGPGARPARRGAGRPGRRKRRGRRHAGRGPRPRRADRPHLLVRGPPRPLSPATPTQPAPPS
jgi:hypothetical protein